MLPDDADVHSAQSIGASSQFVEPVAESAAPSVLQQRMLPGRQISAMALSIGTEEA